MYRRIVQALQIADSLADASAEKAKQPAPDDYSACDWGSVVSALVRAEGRSNSESDCSPDQNVSGVSMIPPRRLVCSSGIPALGRKWPRRSASTKLRQGCVVRVGRDVGGL